MLDPGAQRARKRQYGSDTAFSGVAIVGAGDRDGAARKIDIALPEREQLALAQPEGGAGEERTPVLRDLSKHPADLHWRERPVRALRHFSALDRVERIVAEPSAGLLRLAEHRPQLRTQIVDGRRRRTCRLALVQEVIEMVRPQPIERSGAERSVDHVLHEASDCAAHAARLWTALLQPPRAELGEGTGQLLGAELEAAPLQPRAALELCGHLASFGFRVRGQYLPLAAPVSADVNGPPAVSMAFDARHQVLSRRRSGRGASNSPRAYAIRSAGRNRSPQAIPFARGSTPLSAAL